jgi:hypothetical protein
LLLILSSYRPDFISSKDNVKTQCDPQGKHKIAHIPGEVLFSFQIEIQPNEYPRADKLSDKKQPTSQFQWGKLTGFFVFVGFTT